jgi:hypothetical protein
MMVPGYFKVWGAVGSANKRAVLIQRQFLYNRFQLLVFNLNLLFVANLASKNIKIVSKLNKIAAGKLRLPR